MPSRKKYMIIGNIAAGKTTLARVLGKHFNFPVFHVDQVASFHQKMTSQANQTQDTFRDRENEILELRRASENEFWIIDGYGPFELILERMQKADLIIFLDWPLWRLYFWLFKRQLKLLFRPRPEWPANYNEWSLSHLRRLLAELKRVDLRMHPEIRRILNRPEYNFKARHIQNFSDYHKLLKELGLCSISF